MAKQQRTSFADIDIAEIKPTEHPQSASGVSGNAVGSRIGKTEKGLKDKLKEAEIENERLQQLLSDQEGSEFLVDVKDIDQTPLFPPNRPKEHFETGIFNEMVREIKQKGTNNEAVWLVLNPDPDGPMYRILSGYTRTHACERAEKLVLSKLIDVSDTAEMAAISERANKLRQGESPYTDAQRYKGYLDDKTYLTQKELAKQCFISESYLTQVLQLLLIPDEVVSCISKVSLITVKKTINIVKAVKKDAYKRRMYEDRAQFFFDSDLSDEHLLEIFNDYEYFIRLTEHREKDAIKMSERVQSLDAELKQEQEDLIYEKRETEQRKLEEEEKSTKKHLDKIKTSNRPKNVDLTHKAKKIGVCSRSASGGVNLKFPKEHADFALKVAEKIQQMYEEHMEEQLEQMTN